MKDSRAIFPNLNMTFRSRSWGILPVGRDPEHIARIHQIDEQSSNTKVTNREMAARTTIIRTKDIWYIDLITSRSGPSYRQKEDAVDVLATDENDGFLIETKR